MPDLSKTILCNCHGSSWTIYLGGLSMALVTRSQRDGESAILRSGRVLKGEGFETASGCGVRSTDPDRHDACFADSRRRFLTSDLGLLRKLEAVSLGPTSSRGLTALLPKLASQKRMNIVGDLGNSLGSRSWCPRQEASTAERPLWEGAPIKTRPRIETTCRDYTTRIRLPAAEDRCDLLV